MTHSFPTRRSSDLGTVRGFAIVVRDITDQRAAESALRNSESHLRSILSTVPDAMIVIDERGTMLSFSAAAARLFGYTQAEVLGDRKSTRLNSVTNANLVCRLLPEKKNITPEQK